MYTRNTVPALAADQQVENRRIADTFAEDRPAPTGPRLRNGPSHLAIVVDQTHIHQPSSATIEDEFTPIIPLFPSNQEEEFNHNIPRVIPVTVRSPLETPHGSPEWARGDPIPNPPLPGPGLRRSHSVARPSTRSRRIIGTSLNRNGAPLRSFNEFQDVQAARRRELFFLARSGILQPAPQPTMTAREAFERDEFLDLVQTAHLDSSESEAEDVEQPQEIVPRRRRRRRSTGGQAIPRERVRAPVPIETIRPTTGNGERGRFRTAATQRPLTEEQRIARQIEVEDSLRTGRPRGLSVFLDGSAEERTARASDIVNRRNAGRSHSET